MSVPVGYPSIQKNLPPDQFQTDAINVVNRMNTGKINCVGSETLAVAVETVILDARVTEASHISVMPTSAAASTVAPSVWVKSIVQGVSLTLGHDVPSSGATITYAILG